MWSTRRATRTDVAALAELCDAAVGGDDYVPAFLAEFVRTGVILVAEDAGDLVGMVVYHDVPDGSAWLHAARTRPDYRRQGVATDLMTACESLARRRHRASMRLWANADNVASVRANTKYGFLERGRFTRMRMVVGTTAARVALEPLSAREAWRRVADSPLVRLGRGYVFHDFYFVPVTEASLRWLAREGAVRRLGDNVVSVSEDFEGGASRGLQLQLLAGRPAEIFRAVPSIASKLRAERVETFLPRDATLLKTARRAGFALMDWGQEAVLFEKRLRPRGAGAGSGRRPAAGRATSRSPSPGREALPPPS